MSWAQKRRFIYIGSIAVIVIILAVWGYFAYFYQTPTCFDKKQNQGEVGVDCGGPCNLLCNNQYAPLSVLWSRFSQVSPGIYNVLAYIENPNLNAGADNLNYTFKLYGANGLLLAERDGVTFAPADQIIAIFEPELVTGNQIPVRVEFAFTSQAVWTKQMSQETGLSISQQVLSREETAPRLSFVLTNKMINTVKNIEAVGIVYNAAGNTIAFSRTIVTSIPSQSSQAINFNWPKPFGEPSARTEVILKILK